MHGHPKVKTLLPTLE